MELLLGRSFRLPVLERMVRSMRVGEVARFPRLPMHLTREYPLFATQYRAFARSKGGNCPAAANDGENRRQHRCCGSTAGKDVSTGHPDLDAWAKDPQPLTFTIELLSRTTQFEKEVWHMKEEEARDELPLLRSRGKQAFEAGDVASARVTFAKALALVQQMQSRMRPTDQEWQRLQQQERLPLLANLA